MPAGDGRPRLANPAQKPWIVLQPVFKPIILGFKPNQHTRWLAVARDNNLLILGQAEIPGKVVFYLRQGDFTARFSFGRRALGARLPLLAW